MVAVNSTMLPLGTELPDFTLEDAVSGRSVNPRQAFSDEKALLVMFICNHCPFVKHVMDELTRIGADYRDRAGIVAINSNDIESYPQDAPPRMKELAEEKGWEFPYLMDDSQEVARTFRAACTPDFFVFDGDRKLVYRGQLDDSRPGNDEPVDGRDLRAALDAVLEGKPVSADQTPSIGCNIKWKAGNEPEWFGS